jgi:hypothetical protein
MTVRFCGSIVVVAALAAVLLIPAAADAQGQAIPRLPDGKPDFSGVWDRPRVGDVTRNSTACGAGSIGCKQEGTGELPYTQWGAAKWNNGEGVDWTAYCLPWGYSRSWQTEYPVEIVQTPKRFAVLFESNNIFHTVNMTDPKPADIEPSWLGKSYGRWEGDTLVIETTGFNGFTYLDTAHHPQSDQMTMIERMRFIDANHINYEVTWTDPKTYTRPLKNTRTFVRMEKGKDELMEYWCMENNKDLLDGRVPKFPGLDLP